MMNNLSKCYIRTESVRVSLVVQWVRIHLLMYGTQVQSLVWEDSTCCRATKSLCHNYWACALEPTSRNCWSLCAEHLCSETREVASMRSLHNCNEDSRLLQLEKTACSNEDPSPGASEVAQSCPTLCNPMGCSLPRSSIHGIFQARVLEWIAISFSRGSSRPRDRTRVSCIVGRRFTIWATREVQHNENPVQPKIKTNKQQKKTQCQ